MYLFKSHIQIALLSLGPQVLNCKFSHLLCQLSIDCSGCSFSVIFDCELVYWRVFFSWGSCICFGLWRSLHRASLLDGFEGPYWVTWFRVFCCFCCCCYLSVLCFHTIPKCGFGSSPFASQTWNSELMLRWPSFSYGLGQIAHLGVKAGRCFSISNQEWSSSFLVPGFLQEIQFQLSAGHGICRPTHYYDLIQDWF